MRVEIWSDLICPWCGLGQHRLDEAIRRFTATPAREVELVHRSYQLDPRRPPGVTEPVRAMLAQKLGLADAQIVATTARIEQLAAAEGLAPYHVLDNEVGSTQWAHELAAWATEQGRGHETWGRLYRAYFGERRSIFDHDGLAAVAAEVGLDPAAARDALASGRYAEQVRADGREAAALGARGVPFVVVDRRYGVAGAQPVEAFVEVLEQAMRA